MGRTETIARIRAERPTIAPSLLACDYGNMRAELERLNATTAVVRHIDVMDGHFVPNISFGPDWFASVAKADAAAGAADVIYDVHLMTSSPDQWWRKFVEGGAHTITFHVEAVDDPRPLLEEIRRADIVSGLSIKPDTPPDAVTSYLDLCDQVLVMTVEPGFGGQSFRPECAAKVAALREIAGESLVLSVDGGIGPATIATAAGNGTDLFVAGTADFGQDDYAAAVASLAEAAGPGH
ncbi:MAG: ribulose-phosphate 3-epimerase [Planctomycetota bacterium]